MPIPPDKIVPLGLSFSSGLFADWPKLGPSAAANTILSLIKDGCKWVTGKFDCSQNKFRQCICTYCTTFEECTARLGKYDKYLPYATIAGGIVGGIFGGWAGAGAIAALVWSAYNVGKVIACLQVAFFHFMSCILGLGDPSLWPIPYIQPYIPTKFPTWF